MSRRPELESVLVAVPLALFGVWLLAIVVFAGGG
jgi:hypothetical protein